MKFKLIDDAIVIIYDGNSFIMQATGPILESKAGSLPSKMLHSDKLTNIILC